MNIAKALIVSGILLVGQASAMEPEPGSTSGLTEENSMDQLPQGLREYFLPWCNALQNYKNDKQKVAEGKIDAPERIEEIEACAPAEGFASYKIAIDAGVNQFAQKHNLDEQDTTNLRKFTFSTKGSSLKFINSIQAVEGGNVNNIKMLLEIMRKDNNE